MSASEAVKTYYELFGLRGVVLAARARSLHKSTDATVVVSGIEHPVHVRLRTTDVSVFRQVLVTREYDFEFSKPLRTIIDAGANIGLTSVFYANKYPGATVVAIEPESSNFEVLKRNIAPYPNVIALQVALWNDNKDISLIDPELRHDGFRTVEAPKLANPGDNCTFVRGVTLDKLMSDLNLSYVDMLKLDIEGSEKELFENSGTWIGKVGVIVAELHDQFRSGCARSAYLATKDFDLEWRVGETVFFARKDYVADVRSGRNELMDSQEIVSKSEKSRSRAKIIQYA
jgi:FkbM family methyltransferase